MTIQTIQSVFGWCAVINTALLILWFLFFVLGHKLMYRAHSRLFKLSVESFDALHYGGMALFKLLIIVFNIAPYLALHIAG